MESCLINSPAFSVAPFIATMPNLFAHGSIQKALKQLDFKARRYDFFQNAGGGRKSYIESPLDLATTSSPPLAAALRVCQAAARFRSRDVVARDTFEFGVDDFQAIERSGDVLV